MEQITHTPMDTPLTPEELEAILATKPVMISEDAADEPEEARVLN
jgi:hypothetical protein